ncbi:FAD binding domain-containing protein [Treponema pedis]|uniref:FAD binding domain-containing protein n=1 Tax=Treponema pedis TaxID=409322 RepID=UPI0031341EC5
MFYSPKEKNELLNLLKNIDDSTFIIAGGTDLVIHLKNNKITDYNIIDITKIKEFKTIYETKYFLHIGALLTMSEICENTMIKEKCKALYQAAYELGSTLIRNRATIGGNVCNASQSADCSLALFCFGAAVKILHCSGEEKIIPINEFIIGKEKTILTKNEVVTEILIPQTTGVSAFKKVGARKAVTISKVSCAVEYIPDNDLLTNVRAYLGAVGTKPVRAKHIEAYLENKVLQNINLTELQNIAHNEIENVIPSRSSRFYKRTAVEGLIEDLIKSLKED